MYPRKVKQHFDEDLKHEIAGKRQENMTYNFEIKKVNTSLSAVKTIGQMFVIKGTLNRKVRSGHSRVSTINYNHPLKITVLKENFC